MIAAGIVFVIFFHAWIALALIGFGVNNLLENSWPEKKRKYVNLINIAIALLVVVYFLTARMDAAGSAKPVCGQELPVRDCHFGVVLGMLMTVVHFYPSLLRWCLDHKWKFLGIPDRDFIYRDSFVAGRR